MATSDATLPPMAMISMIAIWVQTVLYGINCVMYGVCMFVLLREGRIATVRWMLLVMSTVIFVLCTIHAGASLQQLLDAFVYAPVDVPDYSTIYWFDLAATPRRLKDYLYATLVLAQHIILIWRCYVVFMRDRRVIILPIILTIGYLCSAYAASAVSAFPEDLFTVAPPLLLSAWVLGFTVNLSVTLAIAGRLWWMGRRMASLAGSSTNRFASSIYVAIESGAISAVVNTVVLTFYANSAALVGLDIASQLVTLTPLLIVVQVALTGRYHVPGGDTFKTVSTPRDEIVFRPGVSGERISQENLSHTT